jgi:hypothetical protein
VKTRASGVAEVAAAKGRVASSELGKEVEVDPEID